MRETGSDAVRAEVAEAELIGTSSVAYAETRAALARARREKKLSAAALGVAKQAFDVDWPHLVRVELTDSILRDAGELAEAFSLRGFDSIHLASFLLLHQNASDVKWRFSSYDDRLNRAARRAIRKK